MKRNLAITVVLLVSFAAFWSCNNELDVTDTWKEVPVLYGLLSPEDTVHIIKVTKAFLGDGNALYMAQIPDSSYYGDEMVATLVEIAPEGWYTNTWVFDTMWVHNKQTGVFFGGDQMLYRVHATLNPTCRYMVTLKNNKSGLLASATTSLVEPISILKPRGGLKYFSFTSTAETQAEIAESNNGRVYQLVIRFNYKEVNFNTLDTVSKYVDWVFPNKKVSSLSTNSTEKIIYSFPGTGFYTNINAKVKEDQDVKRIPGLVDFIAFSGGDELSTYIDITSPINTIVQDRPDYTNVTNGRGIFSSRTSKTHTVELTTQSIDSLVNGIKTFHLGFVFP